MLVQEDGNFASVAAGSADDVAAQERRLDLVFQDAPEPEPFCFPDCPSGRGEHKRATRMAVPAHQ
jgi:hypothetical protein